VRTTEPAWAAGALLDVTEAEAMGEPGPQTGDFALADGARLCGL
jgi:hypothetical protein